MPIIKHNYATATANPASKRTPTIPSRNSTDSPTPQKKQKPQNIAQSPHTLIKKASPTNEHSSKIQIRNLIPPRTPNQFTLALQHPPPQKGKKISRHFPQTLLTRESHTSTPSHIQSKNKIQDEPTFNYQNTKASTFPAIATKISSIPKNITLRTRPHRIQQINPRHNPK